MTRPSRKPVPRKTRHDQPEDGLLSLRAYDILKTAIIRFDLRPGDLVSQSDIERRFGFGKAAIHSSLTKLEQDQLVSPVPRQGYIISRITVPLIENVFDLRLLLEPHATRLATKKIASSQIAELKRLCRVNYRIEDDSSLIPFLVANREFHLVIARSTGNPLLATFCERLHDQSLRMLYLGITLDNQSENWKHGHEEILKALVAGNANKAADVLAQEILESKSQVLKAVLKSPTLSQLNLASDSM